MTELCNGNAFTVKCSADRQEIRILLKEALLILYLTLYTQYFIVLYHEMITLE